MSNPYSELSIQDLEAWDPTAPQQGEQRRFACLLPGCNEKPRDAQHRSLVANMRTGAWLCHRCGRRGRLREFRTGDWRRRPAGRSTAWSTRRTTSGVGATAGREAHTDSIGGERMWPSLQPLVSTPGAAYLARRGITSDVAQAAGVTFAPSFLGRPAVVFEVRNRQGQRVALHGRYIDGRVPKARSLGALRHGIVATAGARRARPVIVVEAPIDALSLAVCDRPAIALCGTRWSQWLPPALAFSTVALALDADAAGDAAAAALAAALAPWGARVIRLRPVGGKDWNELLGTYGAAAMCEALARLGDASL